MTNYSQYGEQYLIDAALGDTKNGIYIDIGAHDGIECSNTRFLWERGWFGILVEPTKERYKKITENYNKRVVIFRNAICKENSTVIINNCIDIKDGRSSIYYDIVEQIGKDKFTQEEVEAITFNDLMIRCKQTNLNFEESNINVISIDAENEDLNILLSIPFKFIRPKVLVIETGQDYNGIMEIMTMSNYRLFARTFANLIFKRND